VDASLQLGKRIGNRRPLADHLDVSRLVLGAVAGAVLDTRLE
jgi:hypothetical protein